MRKTIETRMEALRQKVNAPGILYRYTPSGCSLEFMRPGYPTPCFFHSATLEECLLRAEKEFGLWKPPSKVKVIFRLGMPANNAWNGKWTGADRAYFVVRDVKYSTVDNLGFVESPSSWTYSFGDGWVASVTASVATREELKAKSDGFCGYEWMVDSILKCNAIRSKES